MATNVKHYVKVGPNIFPKRGGVKVGDQFSIPSNCPCFTPHWGNVVEVTDTWNQYEHACSKGGKNGVVDIYGDRFQFAQYVNKTTGVTGSCLSFLLLEAVS
jgi:hypothetical protein